jgi:hypothetical protein
VVQEAYVPVPSISVTLRVIAPVELL